MYIQLTCVFLLFGLFHSLTAQDRFKSWLAKMTSPFFMDHFWRIIYSGLSLVIWIEYFFKPLTNINDTELLIVYPSWLWNILPFIFLTGLGVTYWAFLQFNYYEFLGLKQAYTGIRKLLGYKTQELQVAGISHLEITGIYKYLRHPMLAGGFLMGFGLPPTKPVLFYLLLFGSYMIIGAFYEERRLLRIFGDEYRKYQKKVGAFFPKIRLFST